MVSGGTWWGQLAPSATAGATSYDACLNCAWGQFTDLPGQEACTKCPLGFVMSGPRAALRGAAGGVFGGGVDRAYASGVLQVYWGVIVFTLLYDV